MQKIFIKQITLKDFRNFANFNLSTNGQSVIITGKNGSGKTSILESISLLFPGRGVRGAKFSEMTKITKKSFNIDYLVSSKLGIVNVMNEFNAISNKRTVRFNHDSVMPANDLSKLVNVIWFTPQMQNLLIDSNKARRKFLDRIVFNFESSYANIINQYDHYVYERMKILKNSNNNSLIDLYEYNIAKNAILIIQLRNKIIALLQNAINNILDNKVKPLLVITGEAEKDFLEIDGKNEEIAINLFLSKLKKNRHLDAAVGKTFYGPHRSDFTIIYEEKNIKGEFCSTGEQKMLLVGLLIAQIDLLINKFATKPIILLDEIFTSLDQYSKNKLINYIVKFDLQTWITATDLYGIGEILPHVKHIDLVYA